MEAATAGSSAPTPRREGGVRLQLFILRSRRRRWDSAAEEGTLASSTDVSEVGDEPGCGSPAGSNGQGPGQREPFCTPASPAPAAPTVGQPPTAQLAEREALGRAQAGLLRHQAANLTAVQGPSMSNSERPAVLLLLSWEPAAPQVLCQGLLGQPCSRPVTTVPVTRCLCVPGKEGGSRPEGSALGPASGPAAHWGRGLVRNAPIRASRAGGEAFWVILLPTH